MRLLLPAGYDAKAGRRYPVLLLLHGAIDDYTLVDPSRGRRRRETSPASCRVIVVMPDGGQGGWYTDWYNGGAFGPPKWETYHLRQLLPWVESHYRAVGSRRGRAIAGLSMGGFGTMSYAARHPDMFSSAAAFSGAVDANVPPGIAEPIVNGSSAIDGGKPGDVIGTRADNEVRWRGHNPWDLAANLRGRGPHPPHRQRPARRPFDTGTTPDFIEQTVHTENLSFHRRLGRARDRRTCSRTTGPGSTAGPTGTASLRKTLPGIMARFRHPVAPRGPLSYRAIEPAYSVWGWSVGVQRQGAGVQLAADRRARGVLTLRQRQRDRGHTGGPTGRARPTAWWAGRPSRACAAST